jgi:hypothetical protein
MLAMQGDWAEHSKVRRRRREQHGKKNQLHFAEAGSRWLAKCPEFSC